MNLVIFAFVAACFLPADSLRSSAIGMQLEAVEKKVVAMAERMDPHMRRCLIRKGMTQSAVERILGKKCVIFLSGGGPKPTILFCYYTYHTWVNYEIDEHDEFRVVDVSY